MNRVSLTAPSTGQKVFALAFGCLGVVIAVFLGAVAAVVVSGFLSFETGYDAGIGPFDAPISGYGLVCGVAFGLLPLLWLSYAALRMFRAASWLDGTVLSVRGAFTTRAVDLATATVRIGSRQLYRTVGSGDDSYRAPAGRMPLLEARPPAGGSRVATPLRDARGELLESGKLRALADAITARRGADPEQPDQSEAGAVADALRQVASNPLHRLF